VHLNLRLFLLILQLNLKFSAITFLVQFVWNVLFELDWLFRLSAFRFDAPSQLTIYVKQTFKINILKYSS